jgi:hypothetical protein
VFCPYYSFLCLCEERLRKLLSGQISAHKPKLQDSVLKGNQVHQLHILTSCYCGIRFNINIFSSQCLLHDTLISFPSTYSL